MVNETLLISPLIIITLTAIGALVIDSLSGRNKSVMYIFSFVGLIAAGAFAAYTMTIPEGAIKEIQTHDLLTNNMVTFGGYAAFFDILFCLAGIMTLLAARPFIRSQYGEYKEFYSMVIFSISGMMLMAHSSHLLVLFIGIEVMSVSFYVLAGFFRTSIRSVEAALKYFLLGAFATGFLVYGIAMIYGATGSMDIATIGHKIQTGDFFRLYAIIGFGLLIIGLSFKIAAFPFHQWAPDVYQGAPTVVTAFMSTAGKAAAIIAFIVVARTVMPVIGNPPELLEGSRAAQVILAFISALTMLVGNITAVVQKNVKRMLAYSSVAHAGYMMMGIVANSERGWSGIVFYATAYMFMQIGAFVVVSILEDKEENLELKDYRGLQKSHPALAAMMALFMFSLAGIPPMAGFFGKYYLFAAAIESGFTWLTIVAVISSIISVYFYIGLVVQMYFRDKEDAPIEAKPGPAMITLALSTFGILFFGIFPSLLINLAHSII